MRNKLREITDKYLATNNLNSFSGYRYGWQEKSLGVHVKNKRLNHFWLKVSLSKIEDNTDKLWSGLSSINKTPNLNYPKLIARDEIYNDDFKYLIELQEYIKQPIISDTPELNSRSIIVNDCWLNALQSFLAQVKQISTKRSSIRYDLVKRRIFERFDIHIEEKSLRYTTIHGDLHWANITAPELRVLDWEAWGSGILYFDEALLYAYSLANEQIKNKLENLFKEIIKTEEWKIAYMFVLAELLRMTELYGDHKVLYPIILGESEKIIL